MKNDKEVCFGFSKKIDGQMILGSGDQAFLNRAKFFKKKGIELENIVSAKLDHGKKVRVVTKKDGGRIIDSVDGLITRDKDLCLTVTISDCLPSLFYDCKNKVIGITHVGWRGVVKNINSVLVSKMIKEFGSDSKNIKVYIGPHIKKCHFEIKEDIVDKFKKYKNCILYKNNKIFIDLEKIVVEQLVRNGVLKNNISISKDCTYCNDNYFSFRRDGFGKVVSQVAYIVMH